MATPIGWDELEYDVRFDYFNARSISRRLATLKADPWAAFPQTRQTITAAIRKRVG